MRIGVIGGTGLYEMSSICSLEEIRLTTPFGEPSDAYRLGKLSGVEVVFLPRHGVGHRLLPSEINHRANIWGFKKLGVERVLAVSAVGSLKAEYRPRDVLLPDQFFDRTKASERHTFFGRGIVAHISFADPICPDLQQAVFEVASRLAASGRFGTIRVHRNGVYVNMEGPAFSTRAESEFHRRCGFDVIGMTALAEAKLCREAEICYVPIAMITDYDCWQEHAENVSVQVVLENLRANTSLAQAIIAEAVPVVSQSRACSCGRALEHAIVTEISQIPRERLEELEPIVGKYLPLR